MPQQGCQLYSPKDDIPPGQQWIEGPGPQIGRDGFEGFHGKQRHCGIHMSGFAKEPVANNSFACYQLGLLGVSSGNVCRSFPGATKIGVSGRHQKVQYLDVVPVFSGHYSTLTPERAVRIGHCH